MFFKNDKTVAPTKASAIIEDAEALKIGSVCHVKEKKKIYEGIVVTFGKINQFLYKVIIIIIIIIIVILLY